MSLISLGPKDAMMAINGMYMIDKKAGKNKFEV